MRRRERDVVATPLLVRSRNEFGIQMRISAPKFFRTQRRGDKKTAVSHGKGHTLVLAHNTQQRHIDVASGRVTKGLFPFSFLSHTQSHLARHCLLVQALHSLQLHLRPEAAAPRSLQGLGLRPPVHAGLLQEREELLQRLLRVGNLLGQGEGLLEVDITLSPALLRLLQQELRCVCLCLKADVILPTATPFPRKAALSLSHTHRHFSISLPDYPLGRQPWYFVNESCLHNAFEMRRLKLTACGREEFTCDDGSCVAMEGRCDQRHDCSRDYSDEFSCGLISLPQQHYVKDYAPFLDNDDSTEVHIFKTAYPGIA